MSDATFSVVTSVYTIGGLLGSLFANVLMDRFGRKGTVEVSSTMFVIGSACMSIASGLPLLLLGRVLVGIGAGFGLCVGPIFLSEIAPSKIKGAVGVLTQFAIVIGIMTTQAMGLRLATTRTWRWVLVASSFLSAVQLILGLWMVESPTYLARHKMTKQGAVVAHRLWGATAPVIARQEDNDESVADPLLEHSASDVEDQKHKGRDDAITVPQLLKASNLRTPLMIACFSMLCQQLSGVNAVLYYSNDILSKALPDFGPYVSLGITIVNVIMTFPPIFLIERIGRKKLLSLSAIGALISLWGVGFGLDSGYVTLASLTIITFIASFAIGIGPVPFVMIPEVSPPHAVSALSSVGLSLNWIANFLVGLVFLPLRNLLAHGDASKEGRVFYVFASMLAFCSLVLLSIYRE
ncbi:unnamed protein product [Somion occarium]